MLKIKLKKLLGLTELTVMSPESRSTFTFISSNRIYASSRILTWVASTIVFYFKKHELDF